MTKGLFFAEIDDFWKRQIDSFQNMMGEYASTQTNLLSRQTGKYNFFKIYFSIYYLLHFVSHILLSFI